MRDMGLGLTSLEMVDYYNEELLVRNKFIATYCTSYDVIDPYSNLPEKCTQFQQPDPRRYR